MSRLTPDLYHLRLTLHYIWPRCAPHRPGRPAGRTVGSTGSQLDEEIRLVLRKRTVQAEGLFRREAVVDVAQVPALLC
jgi:hypothetical protein